MNYQEENAKADFIGGACGGGCVILIILITVLVVVFAYASSR